MSRARLPARAGAFVAAPRRRNPTRRAPQRRVAVTQAAYARGDTETLRRAAGIRRDAHRSDGWPSPRPHMRAATTETPRRAAGIRRDAHHSEGWPSPRPHMRAATARRCAATPESDETRTTAKGGRHPGRICARRHRDAALRRRNPTRRAPQRRVAVTQAAYARGDLDIGGRLSEIPRSKASVRESRSSCDRQLAPQARRPFEDRDDAQARRTSPGRVGGRCFGIMVGSLPVFAARSVVVDDLDVRGVPVLELETNPELVVDADAVLPGAIAGQFFQAVARRWFHALTLFGNRANCSALRASVRPDHPRVDRGDGRADRPA